MRSCSWAAWASQVVARLPIDVPRVEWFLGLDDRNCGVARAPFGGCGFPPLFRRRVDAIDQGVAWCQGSFCGHGAQRKVGPCVMRERGFDGVSRPVRRHRTRCPPARVLVGIGQSFRSRETWGGWPTTSRVRGLGHSEVLFRFSFYAGFSGLLALLFWRR